MTRCYIFRSPDQLNKITLLCKDGSFSKIANVAKVWSVNMRQKEKTPWDGKIGVHFCSDGGERNAYVFRYSTNNEKQVLGWLKYNAALKWCEEHLMKIE